MNFITSDIHFNHGNLFYFIPERASTLFRYIKQVDYKRYFLLSLEFKKFKHLQNGNLFSFFKGNPDNIDNIKIRVIRNKILSLRKQYKNLNDKLNNYYTEYVISIWNDKVKDNDTVYFLGDFGFFDKGKSDLDNLVSRLNGNIVFIKGNHDRKIIQNKFKVQDYIIYNDVLLSHYPVTKEANKRPLGKITNNIFIKNNLKYNIHGHTHTVDIDDDNIYNVCFDKWNTLLNLDDIITELKGNK